MSETIEDAIQRLEHEIKLRHRQLDVLREISGQVPAETPLPPVETVSMQMRVVILPPSVPPEIDEQDKAPPEPVPLVAETKPEPEPTKQRRKLIDDDLVRKLHAEGKTVREMAKEIGCSDTGLRLKLEQLGLAPHRERAPRVPMPPPPPSPPMPSDKLGGVVQQALAWCKTQQMIVVRSAGHGYFHAGKHFTKAADFIAYVNEMRRERKLPPFPQAGEGA